MNILSFSPGTLLKTIYTAPLNVHKNDFGLSLDVSYITQRLIVCSYPVIKYPKMLYRHSLKDLVLYLNLTHGTNCWRIYNFKIEVGSSDYSDENLYSLVKQSTPPVCSTIDTGTYLSVFADSSCRSSLSEVCTTRETTTEEVTEIEKTNAIMRFGWLDHSPPPFLMLQDMIESVHEFLCEDSARVVVFHCKMGKGRSGTVAIAYMMKYMQCSLKEASEIFSNNRFRGGITKGVTIASQLRFLRYHEMLMCFGQRIDDRLVTMEIAACRFRLVEIELHDIATFPSIGVGFSKPVIVAKMQAFNKQRSALNDLLSINFDSTNNNCIFENGTSCKGLAALVLDTADLRVSFAIQSDGHEFIKNITQLTSSAHCWLNLYWETVLCSKSDSSTYYRKVELLQEQSRSRISPNLAEFNISWDELDGMKGSQVKGLRLFRSLTLKWHLL
ncbi:LAMI_0B01750g1_1 [Lachancea mirantina]|uniref:phosphatidylinositol-3,4,5-trisphosphate 3-phosphatase n=1 Tax=Lachancea mirantina TaxID=1230905 RepID=A0A1G4ITU9_9SACH|nr:LAMI_0B01750g1_1 [Lachancea mirantina]